MKLDLWETDMCSLTEESDEEQMQGENDFSGILVIFPPLVSDQLFEASTHLDSFC